MSKSRNASNGDARPRKRGLKADYGGATPEEVARALYWHRRDKPRTSARPAEKSRPVEAA